MANGKGHGMTIIVKTVTRLTVGFILLYGIYIALNGHVAVGGGFAGGVIVALSFVHIMLAFGKEITLRHLHSYSLRIAVGVAAIVFLAATGAGLWGFHAQPVTETVIPVAETVLVGSGVFAIFVALVLLSKTDRDAE